MLGLRECTITAQLKCLFLKASCKCLGKDSVSLLFTYVNMYNDPMSEGSPWNLLLQSHRCFSDALAREVELGVITTKGETFPVIHIRGDDACYHEHPLSCI